MDFFNAESGDQHEGPPLLYMRNSPDYSFVDMPSNDDFRFNPAVYPRSRPQSKRRILKAIEAVGNSISRHLTFIKSHEFSTMNFPQPICALCALAQNLKRALSRSRCGVRYARRLLRGRGPGFE
jgi:hypothetical protein